MRTGAIYRIADRTRGRGLRIGNSKPDRIDGRGVHVTTRLSSSPEVEADRPRKSQIAMPDSQESEELLSDSPEPCEGPLEDVETTPADRTTHETEGIHNYL